MTMLHNTSMYGQLFLVTTASKDYYVHGTLTNNGDPALREHVKNDSEKADTYYDLSTLLVENSEPHFGVILQ